MRAKWLVPAALVLALVATAGAGDGDKPTAPAKPAETPTAPAVKSKDADKPKDADKAKSDEKAKAEKQAALLAAQRPAPKDLDDAMRRLARVRVSVTFKDTPYAECVDYVRRVAGFNVMVAPVLAAKGLEGIKPITMTLTNVSLKQVVDLLNQFSGTKCKFEESILQFTTPQDARGKPVLKIYSIGDLTMRLHNFPGPELDLRPAHAEFEPEKESDVENAWSDPQKIVDMIQKTCGEETWTDKDVSIQADENKLIVRQYAEVHREISRLIWMLRSSR